jgi:tetratricopeptide (TPR) repeat protein
LLKRGYAHTLLSQWDAARADFQRVIAGQDHFRPEEVRTARDWLGGIAHDQGHFDLAFACWTPLLTEYESFSLDVQQAYADHYAPLYLYRAKLYSHLQHYEESIADYDRVIALSPTSAEAFSLRGLSYAFLSNQEHQEQSLADSLHAVELEPQEAAHYRRLGEVRLLQEEYAQVLACLDQALALDPNDELTQELRRKAQVRDFLDQLVDAGGFDDRTTEQGANDDEKHS